ncbi:receptor [Tyrophagus putrescentiae]|nr:receptor [Tyrophagus putrescentiae]
MTIVGNVFVIAAIIMERNLRTTGNYLVLSLAVADLMVACLVMPLGAFSEITQSWTLGTFLCDIWTSFDLLCCTASILHLLAIALDRYWAVTYVDYIHKRTPKRISFMIFMVWTVAVIVSIAPLVGWKDPDFQRRVINEKRCLISQDIGYQIFATISTFYAPLIFILLLYWKIYQVARKRIRHKPGKTITPASEANPKIIDLRNEKSLAGKRRLFVPAKGTRAEKGKKAGAGALVAAAKKNNYNNSANGGGNGGSKGAGGGGSGGGGGLLNSKARAIMGINNSSISLEENNNNNSNSTGGRRSHELVNYLAVYSPSGEHQLVNTTASSTVGRSNGNGGGGGVGGVSRGMCQSMVTLDASQLVAVAMARVESATEGVSATECCTYDQMSSTEGEKNGSIAETPSANGSEGTVGDQDTDHAHHNSASGLVEAVAAAVATSTGADKGNNGNHLPNYQIHQQQHHPPAPLSVHSSKQLNSSSGNKPRPSGMSTLSSGPSSATSSPAVTMTRLNHRPMHAITVDSYHTTSSPASTSSNYHLHTSSTSHQNAVRATKAIKESIESKRERKAAKILAIITGIFVICWLPFFITALLMPLCEACSPSMFVFSIFQWLGYINSLLNPIIYTIFSPDFRNGFRRILCGRKR